MRRTPAIVLSLVFVLLFSWLLQPGCSYVKNATVTENDFHKFLESFFKPDSNIDQLKTDLEDATKRFKGEDNKFIERLKFLVAEFEKNPKHEQAGDLLELNNKLLLELTGFKKDDFDTQFLAVTYGLMFSQMARTQNMNYTGIQKEWLNKSQALIKKFPDKPKAYSNYAFALAISGGDFLDILKNYKKCLDLDSENKSCREGYDSALKKYTEKYCTKPDIGQNLGIYEVAKNGKLKISHAGEELALRSNPIISNRDLEKISVTADGFGEDQITIRLTEDASRKFYKFTKMNIEKRAAVVLDGKIISTPVIREVIQDGEMMIPKIKIENVCRKITVNKVPKELLLE